jgi:Fe-S cluster assembly protein SufD
MSQMITKDTYLSNYLEVAKEVPGKDVPWLKALREKALAHFAEAGFPTTKDEFWKYTDLTTSLLKVPFGFEAESTVKTVVSTRLKASGFEWEKANVLIFVNGVFVKEFSSVVNRSAKFMKLQNLASAFSEGISRQSLEDVVPFKDQAFTALNTAYFTDGLFLWVPSGQQVLEPIHVVYLSTNSGKATQSHLRNLILLEDDSQATVIEHYWGDNVGPYLTNAVTEARLSKGARLDHTKVQQESENGYHIGSFAVKQGEGSHLISRVFSTGGALGRSEVETSLTEKKAECVLEGLYLVKGKQHMDTRTFIDHIAPACKSQEVFKGVLDGASTGIFDGRILVRENAQKTDARQSNKNLQLSNECKVYSKPQLKIFADDVKCSHGSATGQLDEEALFYLQSRGIGREEAKRTLVYAFAGEMLERVALDYLKAPLRKMLNEWMEKKL